MSANHFARTVFRTATALSGGGLGFVAVAHLNKNKKSGFLACLNAESISQPHLDPQGFDFPRSKWDTNWDRCEVMLHTEGLPEDERPKRPKATRHLLLIRHGQYNLKGLTDEERRLTELGRTQADETGQRLAELDIKFTKIIQSNMSRAMETAELISTSISDVPVEKPDPILREGGPIRPEPDSNRFHPDADYFADGSRIESAFRKYFRRALPEQSEDSHEIIVCHANVIRYFVCRALQLPPEAWLRISLKHASITWVTIRPDGKVSLRSLGDAGHFSPEKLTTS